MRRLILIILVGSIFIPGYLLPVSAGESTNIISNGSFENVVGANFPVGWAYRYEGSGCTGMGLIPEYVKEKVKKEAIPSVIVDTETSAVGKKSLRINNPSTNLMISGVQNWQRYLKPNQSYTVSLYLKSDKSGEGKEVNINFGAIGEKRFKVTTEWTRYTYTFKSPVEASPSFQIWWQQAGTLWIDGVQLEKGENVHDYMERAYEEY